jgi:DNA-binding YbaB/EbfC family protein
MSQNPFEALGGGGFDMNALLQQAQQMQQQLLAAQAQAAEEVHEGTAGGGAVRIEVTGGMEFRSVTIRPDAVDPDDVEMLQDLVLAAVNEAVGKVTDAQQSALGGLGGMLGGGGAGGLGGLLGP